MLGGIFTVYTKTRRERAKTEPGSFQQCPVTRPGQWPQTERQDISSEHQKTLHQHEGDRALA